MEKDPIQIQKNKFVEEIIKDLKDNPDNWSSMKYSMMSECIYKGDITVYKTGSVFSPIHIELDKDQKKRIEPLIKIVYDNDYLKYFTKHFNDGK